MRRILWLLAAIGLILAMQGCAIYASPYGYSTGYYGYAPYFGFSYDYWPYSYYSYPAYPHYGYGHPRWGRGHFGGGWGGGHWGGHGGWRRR